MSTHEHPGADPSARPVLRRSKTDRILGGVAGGLGAYLGVDPILIRIAFIILGFTGSGVLIYIIAWIIMPEEKEGDTIAGSRRIAPSGDAIRLLVGGVLIAVGALILLRQAIPWEWIEDLIGPAILIAIGAAVLVYGARK